LIENGKSFHTPTAVVRWGTRPDQKTIVATLGTIAGVIQEEHIRPPAVMIVGNVVRLRETLKWYENKPLFGHRILITREYSYDYEILEDLGAEIFGFPTIKTVEPLDYTELDKAIDDIEQYNWLVFSSVKGFSFFFNRLIHKGRDIRDLKGIKLCAVGPKTAESINKMGLKVDLIPSEFNSEGLIKTFLGIYENLKGIKILLPRPDNARDLFPEMIRKEGAIIDTPTAYRVIKPERHGKRLQRFLKEGRITIATFTSAATFNNFLDIMGNEALDFLKGLTIASIGPVTTKAIEKRGLNVSIQPNEATIKAMSKAIVKWVAPNFVFDELD
ncbi:MAG: uroporphyrinogen-III synthase, partial [Thermodesulfovibrionales bacterium]|nr:uroporphyrinogen-III synthase [Thermodesulfovibrionales bacterium]